MIIMMLALTVSAASAQTAKKIPGTNAKMGNYTIKISKPDIAINYGNKAVHFKNADTLILAGTYTYVSVKQRSGKFKRYRFKANQSIQIDKLNTLIEQ